MCGICPRKVAAGSCVDGYVHYLSGDYPCPFNPDVLAEPRNLVELPALERKPVRAAPVESAEGLEDLL